MKVLKTKKGFTLVELIVVITIIGILAAVLVPSITGYIGKAKESAALQEAKALETPYITWQIERVDMEDGLTPDLKNDFAQYVASLNILSSNQTILKIETKEYIEGFRFQASNGFEVIALYDAVNGKLTLELAN